MPRPAPRRPPPSWWGGRTPARGAVHGATDGWAAPLLVLAATAAAYGLSALVAGRAVLVGGEATGQRWRGMGDHRRCDAAALPDHRQHPQNRGAGRPGGLTVPTYVALGSSFASGPGIEPIIDASCSRSANNYPHLVAGQLGLDLVDVTAGGAAIPDVLTRPQALLAGGTVPPQVQAVAPDTDLVTVTAGGNDVDYLLTLMRCSHLAVPDAVPAAMRAFLGFPVAPAAVDAALDALPAKLAGLVSAVRTRAPRARVVLVDYLTVVPDRADSALPVSEQHRRLCAGIARRLEEATAVAAARAGAELVAASQISRDHAVGAAQPWVTGWEFGDVLTGGIWPYHPNAAGMRAVAGAVVERLTR